MATVQLLEVEFDLNSTYFDTEPDLARIKEIESDLRGYVFEIDEDCESIDDAIYTKLYNFTGLEIRQFDYQLINAA